MLRQRRLMSPIWLVIVAGVLVGSGNSAATYPKALHVVVTAQAQTDIVIQLLPNATGGYPILATQIGSVPSSGALYQLSQVYAVYGYMPQKGTQITSSYTNVSSLASNRVLFSAPIGFTGANFTYYAINKYGMSTSAGIVYITVDGSAVSSPFTTSNENWFVVYDATASAGWSATSIGNLNHFIYSDSIPYVVGSANTARWSFTAPSKFSGNFERAYNGYISFWLTSFAGDFTTSVYPNPKTFVALTCATCASGAGITLAQRNITWVGDTRLFNFTLNEQPINGWKKDPKSVFLSWTTPTNCDFFNVLSGLSSVAIYPDVSTGQESVGLDDVRIVFGQTDNSVSCYP
ncbi:Laminin IV type A domain-containing protein [Plasmodiophora brassicae]